MNTINNSCVVVILTFNSEKIIPETIGQALKVSPYIFVVDSGSKDKTTEVAKELGCEVVERTFINYSEQRNWAINKMAQNYYWQLHLDADEVLDDTVVDSICNILQGNSTFDAYLVKRRDYFMGKMLHFSGVNPWHLRLFKSGVGHCENRLYDQHFVSSQPTGKLSGFMHDKNVSSIAEWITSHNRWSDFETDQIFGKNVSVDVLQPFLFGDARERTRFNKIVYYKLPIGIRALSYFVYRYVFRLGFFDGAVGFYFAFFQAFWFRMLIDAKIYEKKLKEKNHKKYDL
jgi:glycosyltransferase involved in cell wall biosynthesis